MSSDSVTVSGLKIRLVLMELVFIPPRDGLNSCITVTHDNTIKKYGSFVFYNEKAPTCCAEDVYRNADGSIKYKGKREFDKLVDSFVMSKSPFQRDCEIYRLPCGDFVLISQKLRLLVYTDNPSDNNVDTDIREYNELKVDISSSVYGSCFYALLNETLTDVYISKYDLYAPTVFEFDNDKTLLIYCFWKLALKDKTVCTSYECRNKHSAPPVLRDTLNALKGSFIKSIIAYDNVITRITFSNGYDLYVYIDNRFFDMPQIKVFNGDSTEKLIYSNGELKLLNLLLGSL